MNTPCKPLLISAGLVCGHSDHLFKLHKSFVEKNWIEPNEKVDFVIHTWDIPFNNQYVDSLKRYESKFNIILTTETYDEEYLPLLDKTFGVSAPLVWKECLLFYSFWKACHLIGPTIDRYDIVIKYKTDIKSNGLPYGIKEDLPLHFKTTSLVTFPLLYNYSFLDCIYGIRVYDGFIERCFTTFPKVLKKLFIKKELDDLFKEISTIRKGLYSKYIKPYNNPDSVVLQGPALWGEFMKLNDVPIIGSTLYYWGEDKGDITPPFSIELNEHGSFVVNPENYKYIYKKDHAI